jgi:hypothetical protein
MHFRITKVSHAAGKRDELIAMLKSKEDIIQSFEGLKYVKMVAVSDTQTVAISEYESEAALIAVEGRFKEVMVGMVPLMTGPPEVLNGDVFWDMTL